MPDQDDVIPATLLCPFAIPKPKPTDAIRGGERLEWRMELREVRIYEIDGTEYLACLTRSGLDGHDGRGLDAYVDGRGLDAYVVLYDGSDPFRTGSDAAAGIWCFDNAFLPMAIAKYHAARRR